MSQILRKRGGRGPGQKFHQETSGVRFRESTTRCSMENKGLLLSALRAWEARQGIPQHISGYERQAWKKTAPVIPQ